MFSAGKVVSEPTLVEINEALDPAVAQFSDGSVLEFPKGMKLEDDPHIRDDGTSKFRMRHDFANGGHVFIPKNASKKLVMKVIERMLRGA